MSEMKTVIAKALPEKVKVQLKQIEATISQQHSIANAIMFGARAALEVPDDWVFNHNLMAFAPPEKPKEEPEETT